MTSTHPPRNAPDHVVRSAAMRRTTTDSRDMNHTRTRATDFDVPENSPVVYWPEPGPLHHWWTEIMSGGLTPSAARAAR